ncbi:hypothetical protein [Niastella yeongjuensis]|nr:hypothetical protein [Niastella yeongjuensis]SEN29864.1 hypothetical protein SAMN05660816_00652 [Niastella yeongjuensis]
MKKFYLLIVCCILCSITWAQKNGLVKGIAFDTLSKQPRNRLHWKEILWY